MQLRDLKCDYMMSINSCVCEMDNYDARTGATIASRSENMWMFYTWNLLTYWSNADAKQVINIYRMSGNVDIQCAIHWCMEVIKMYDCCTEQISTYTIVGQVRANELVKKKVLKRCMELMNCIYISFPCNVY